MSRFLDRVIETTQVVGAGMMLLDGAAVGYRTFAAGLGGSGSVFYFCIGDPAGADAAKWEFGWGTLSPGTPDTLTRNLVVSSTGALISWVAGNKIIMSTPVGQVFNSFMVNNRGTNRPPWLLQGGMWIKSDAAPYPRLNLYDGDADIGFVDLDEANNRAYFIDPGGARLAGLEVSVAATAGIVDLSGIATQNIRITGSGVSITGWGNLPQGVRRYLSFAGAVTLVHNGTSHVLFNNANILTGVNDRLTLRSLGGGNWEAYMYYPAVGFLTAGSISVPVGTVTAFAGNTEPGGWLFCHGQSVAVATYSALHGQIGYLYGGAGANFNIPDLRGRVPVGKDNGVGRMTVIADGLGQAGGDQIHVLTEAQMPSHLHAYSNSVNSSHNHTLSGGGSIGYNAVQLNDPPSGISGISVGVGINLGGPITAAPPGIAAAGGVLGFSGNTDSRGSTQWHNNTQPSLITNYIIKY